MVQRKRLDRKAGSRIMKKKLTYKLQCSEIGLTLDCPFLSTLRKRFPIFVLVHKLLLLNPNCWKMIKLSSFLFRLNFYLQSCHKVKIINSSNYFKQYCFVLLTSKLLWLKRYILRTLDTIYDKNQTIDKFLQTMLLRSWWLVTAWQLPNDLPNDYQRLPRSCIYVTREFYRQRKLQDKTTGIWGAARATG